MFPYSFWHNINLRRSLLAFWTFNDSGNIGLDSLGVFNASTVGSVSSVAGKIGNAIQNTASPGYLTVTDTNKVFNLNTDKTFVLWMKCTDVNGYLFGKYFGITNPNFLGSFAGDVFLFDVNTDGTDAQAVSNSVLTTNTWFFLVFKHIKASQTISVQVNNGAIFTATYTGNLFDDAENLRLLEEGDDGTFIDSFGIWSRLLTSEEITYLYNSGNGREYPF